MRISGTVFPQLDTPHGNVVESSRGPQDQAGNVPTLGVEGMRNVGARRRLLTRSYACACAEASQNDEALLVQKDSLSPSKLVYLNSAAKERSRR